MLLNVEVGREADGRWLAEVPELPGVTAYGGSREEAVSQVQALALKVLADETSGVQFSPSEMLPLDPYASEVEPVSDWQKAELDRRKENLRQNPASGLTWEEVQRRVRSRHGR